MTPQVLATAKVHWLDSDQGARSAPPSGYIYAATGQFAEREDEHFSVVLRFPPKKTSQMHSISGAQQFLDEAELGFLAPELVEKKLAPGRKLLISEGPRIVAECEIQSVRPSPEPMPQLYPQLSN